MAKMKLILAAMAMSIAAEISAKGMQAEERATQLPGLGETTERAEECRHQMDVLQQHYQERRPEMSEYGDIAARVVRWVPREKLLDLGNDAVALSQQNPDSSYACYQIEAAIARTREIRLEQELEQTRARLEGGATALPVDGVTPPVPYLDCPRDLIQWGAHFPAHLVGPWSYTPPAVANPEDRLELTKLYVSCRAQDSYAQTLLALVAHAVRHYVERQRLPDLITDMRAVAAQRRQHHTIYDPMIRLIEAVHHE
jgi:hypothetical protein